MFKKFCLILLCCIFALPFAACGDEVTEDTVYTICAEYNEEAEMLSAKMTVDYFNDTDTEIKTLKFNLPASAYREGAKQSPCTPQSELKAYYAGESYGGITVEACTEADERIDWQICGQDENILSLSLKKGVFPAERTVVGVEFKVEIPRSTLRLGVTKTCVNLGDWYPVLCAHEDSGFYECEYAPIGDPYFYGTADYTVELTVPGEYTVAAGGECVLTEVGEQKTTYTYKYQNVRDVAFVLSKGYRVLTGKVGDVDVTFCYLSRPNPERALDAAVLATECFTELFGEYPYQSLTIAETDFLQGGMEYPSLVYVSSTLSEEDFITATVHEVAHQWWGCAVGNNQIKNAFLDEGLAEYSTLLFYEKNPSYGLTREGVVKAKTDEYRAFYGVFEQLKGEVNTAMDRSLKDFSGEYEYVEMCYVKPVLMLDEFRRGVGDARFFKGLKRYYKENEFSVAEPAHLISAFKGVGCDAEGFFNAWIDGKVLI